MQAEKIALWIKAITKAVIYTFRQLHKWQDTWSHYDPCVYYNKLPGEEYIYLLLYVDNMLSASKSKYVIDKLKKDLSFEFEMKDLSKAKNVLDKEVEKDWKGGKVSLTQKG